MNTEGRINSFLRKKKITTKTEITLSLLVELLYEFNKENEEEIKRVLDTLEFTKTRMAYHKISTFEIDSVISDLKRKN